MISKTGFIVVFVVAVIWFMCAMAYTYTTAIKDFINLKRDRDKAKAMAKGSEQKQPDA